MRNLRKIDIQTAWHRMALWSTCGFLSSCYSRPAQKALQSAPEAPSPQDAPEQIMAGMASWGAYAGSFGLFASVLLLVFGRRKLAMTVALASIGLLVVGQALGFAADYLAWLTAICVLTAAAFLAMGAWAHRVRLEPWLRKDLDGDGDIDGIPRHPSIVADLRAIGGVS